MRQALVAVGLVALAGCHGDPVRPAGRDREPAGPVVRLVYSMDVGDRGDGGNDDAGVGAPADRKAALEQAVDTIRRRIADRGVADPAVAAAGDRIVVELPGADPEATDRVRDVLARRGDLVVRVVDSGAPLMKALYGRVGSRHPSTEPEAAAAGIVAYPDYWQNPADGSNVFDYTLQAEDRQESMSRDRARELGCIGAPSPDGLVACTVSGRERLARYL
ncbi:MAG TPA: hypothetical protein VHE35_04465, partial [Kofleriaceae bacterium]|nr:hypothetical protein [Kofleriaceae bacterium]